MNLNNHRILSLIPMLILLAWTNLEVQAAPVRFALKRIDRDIFASITMKSFYIEALPWHGEFSGCHSTPKSALTAGDSIYVRGMTLGGWGEGEIVWVVAPCDADVDQASVIEWTQAVKTLEDYYQRYQRQDHRSSRLPSSDEQYNILNTYTRIWRQGFKRAKRNQFSKEDSERIQRVKDKALASVVPEKAAIASEKKDLKVLGKLVGEYEGKRSELTVKTLPLLHDYQIFRDSWTSTKEKLQGVIQRINESSPAFGYEAIDQVVKEKLVLQDLLHEEREASSQLAFRASVMTAEWESLDSDYQVHFEGVKELFGKFSIENRELNSLVMIDTLQRINEYAKKRYSRLQSKIEMITLRVNQVSSRLVNQVALHRSKEASFQALQLASSTKFVRMIQHKTDGVDQSPKRGLLKSEGIEIPMLYLKEHFEKMKVILDLTLGCENPSSFMETGCDRLEVAKDQARSFIDRIPTIIETGALLMKRFGKGVGEQDLARMDAYLDNNDLDRAVEAYDNLLLQIDEGSRL